MLYLEIENLLDEGCNNGNYPGYKVFYNDGTVKHGVTCRCLNGCSGTDNISDLYFNGSIDDMIDFLNFQDEFKAFICAYNDI